MRRSAIALLAILFVVSATETSFAFYRCRMTGAIGPACCCAGDRNVAPPSGPALSDGSCCERGTIEVSRAPSEAPPRAETAAAAPVVALAVAAAGPDSGAVLAASRAPVIRPPPWRGSLTLLKKSLLI